MVFSIFLPVEFFLKPRIPIAPIYSIPCAWVAQTIRCEPRHVPTKAKSPWIAPLKYLISCDFCWLWGQILVFSGHPWHDRSAIHVSFEPVSRSKRYLWHNVIIGRPKLFSWISTFIPFWASSPSAEKHVIMRIDKQSKNMTRLIDYKPMC